MSANPLSVSGGAGPIIPASLVNPQTQATKTQAADTSGTKPQREVDRNVNELNPSKQNKPVEGNVKGVPIAPEDDRPITIEEAEETFQEYLSNLPSDIKFQLDKDTNRLFFKLVNPVTREVVKQFPPDEFIEMVKRLKAAEKNMTGKGGVFLDDRS
jgi:uncharacterized FlaG/YvyC family protein